MTPSPATILLAVNGTLMRGLELNPNLIAVGAKFICETRTEPAYRIWSINDKHPAMVRVNSGGAPVDVEVWAVPPEGLATILLQEPPGLTIGKVKLANGSEVLGVLGEPVLCEGQREITRYGGWRGYLYVYGKDGAYKSPEAAGLPTLVSPHPMWVEKFKFQNPNSRERSNFNPC